MSLPQHVREGPIDALVTQLKRIASDPSVEWASTQTPDVSKLSAVAIQGPTFPKIMVVIQGEQKTDRSNSGRTRIQDSTMQVLVECWVKSSHAGEDLSRLLHDVEKVIALDPSLLDTARDSRVSSNQTTLTEEDSDIAAVLVTVEILYGHLDTDPSSRR